MLPNADIDAVLQQAQAAVDELASATGVATPPSARPAAPRQPPKPAPTVSYPPAVRRILDLKVPVIVRLARARRPIRNIMQLAVGSILEFEHPVDQELELLANNKAIGAGVAVKVGEKFGLKVTYIGDVAARISSLGPR